MPRLPNHPFPPGLRIILGPVAALGVACLASPGALAQKTPPAAVAPLKDPGVFKAFHGAAGVQRVTDAAVARAAADPRIAEAFRNKDPAQLKRVLAGQICALADGPCAAKNGVGDFGVRDTAALAEDLRWAMNREGVPFRAQDRLLASLAPTSRHGVVR